MTISFSFSLFLSYRKRSLETARTDILLLTRGSHVPFCRLVPRGWKRGVFQRDPIRLLIKRDSRGTSDSKTLHTRVASKRASHFRRLWNLARANRRLRSPLLSQILARTMLILKSECLSSKVKTSILSNIEH